MISRTGNPLLEANKEIVGSTTYSKYQYQYHWALYKILDKHTKGQEYAVFVELHEDVIIANSLEKDVARFEFNQIKTTKGKFTKEKLSKQQAGKSPLGKLIRNCLGKNYSDRIDAINFVALNDFKLKLKSKGLRLDAICITTLETSDFEELKAKLEKEVGASLPLNIYFVVPDLAEKGFHHTVVGKIADLVKALHPSSYCSSIDIYRTLIDELNRKGTNIIDYEKWEDELEGKALTSEKVTHVINSFTGVKDEGRINSEFEAIAGELGLNVMQRKALKRAFDRYRVGRTGSRSSMQIQKSQSIIDLIDKNWKECGEKIGSLISMVCDQISTETKRAFVDETELRGAIIWEFVTKDLTE